MKKEQILLKRKQQQEFENRRYRIDEKYIELIKRVKDVRHYVWIADTYIDTLFETENALDKLLVLREQGFINFEVDNGDIRNYISYKSKIAKALEREVV